VRGRRKLNETTSGDYSLGFKKMDSFENFCCALRHRRRLLPARTSMLRTATAGDSEGSDGGGCVEVLACSSTGTTYCRCRGRPTLLFVIALVLLQLSCIRHVEAFASVTGSSSSNSGNGSNNKINENDANEADAPNGGYRQLKITFVTGNGMKVRVLLAW